ncbi:MAG: SMP-30/gluconolactonase/LRE family protein [Nitrospirae bacterium]|nr:SMP-30/gluconolactonase/LRE family protein [Nitrospirota bacterium]
MKRAIQTVIGIGIVVVLSACAAMEPVRSRVERSWPTPPDPPVISYLNSFSEPKDMGAKRSWFMKAVEFLFGEEGSPHMLRPYAVATDGSGRVYVADTGLQTVHIYDFPSKSYQQIFWIVRGRSRLMSPVGVALDEKGLLYVSDSQLNRIFVYEPKRRRLVKTIGEPGQFQRLTGIAYHPKLRRLYAVDTAAHRVTVFDPDGNVVTTFGQRGEKEGELNFPTHIAVDSKGALYITDSMNFRVQIFDSEGKFQGKLGQMGNILGSFSKPKGVAVDLEGHIYVVDGIFDTIQIFDRTGDLLMNFGQTGEKEGDFYLPAGIAIDDKNRIYVADTYNQRVQVFLFLGSPKEDASASQPQPAGGAVEGTKNPIQ